MEQWQWNIDSGFSGKEIILRNFFVSHMYTGSDHIFELFERKVKKSKIVKAQTLVGVIDCMRRLPKIHKITRIKIFSQANENSDICIIIYKNPHAPSFIIFPSIRT